MAADERDDLDALVRRVDPDRWLASRFIADPARRADVIALYAYDHELTRATRVASTPLMAEIRLTWWRETVEEIHGGRPIRAHPTAVALGQAVRRRGLPLAPLEAMIDGRIAVLGEAAYDPDTATHWADDVGGSCAELASLVLDPSSPVEAARRVGRVWGLLALRRAGSDQGGALDASLHAAISETLTESRRVSARAFPAVAAATLARAELAGETPSELGVRVRLLWAVIRGRI